MEGRDPSLWCFRMVSSTSLPLTGNCAIKQKLCVIGRWNCDTIRGRGDGWFPGGARGLQSRCEARRTSRVCSIRTRLRHQKSREGPHAAMRALLIVCRLMRGRKPCEADTASYCTSACVSRAMHISSSAATTISVTGESSAEMMRSSPRPLLRSGSSFMPR